MRFERTTRIGVHLDLGELCGNRRHAAARQSATTAHAHLRPLDMYAAGDKALDPYAFESIAICV